MNTREMTTHSKMRMWLYLCVTKLSYLPVTHWGKKVAAPLNFVLIISFLFPYSFITYIGSLNNQLFSSAWSQVLWKWYDSV